MGPTTTIDTVVAAAGDITLVLHGGLSYMCFSSQVCEVSKTGPDSQFGA